MFVAILTLLLAIQSAPAQQQSDRRTWYQAYADAQKAVQDRNWQKAIADLSVAAQRGAPKPGRNVLFYGDVYRDYNPDYYLGVAYANLQRFAEADSAFERVKQAQLISTRDSLYPEFTRQAGIAKDAIGKGAIGNNAQNQAPAQGRQTAPTAAALNPANAQRPSSNVAQTAPNAQNPSVPTSNNPPVGLNPPPAANAAASAVQRPPPVVPDPKVAAAANARNPVARPSAPAKTGFAPVLALPLATAAIQPLDERVGVLQFFSGDYEKAAASLATVAYGPGASARTHFYLACSQVALVLTGKAPRTSLEAARAELALARDAGQFAADKRLISPRIMQELGMQP